MLAEVYVSCTFNLSIKKFDVIINCIGVGVNPDKLVNYFSVTEKYDNLIIDYLQEHSDCIYINMSSGAIYGDIFLKPVDIHTTLSINPNKIKTSNLYTIAKLNSEAKHRTLFHLNIVDLRLFSFFSRFANLEEPYFMNELISCCNKATTFCTNDFYFTRDFIHPKDLFSWIEYIIMQKTINTFCDIKSRFPITKDTILKLFADIFGLRYAIQKMELNGNNTGNKNCYYVDVDVDTNEDFIFKDISSYTSEESLLLEAKYFLNNEE
jgi:nucleoside-diphosphate-sugar epimerase